MTRKRLNRLVRRISRRRTLQGVGALVGSAALGCNDGDDQQASESGTSDSSSGTEDTGSSETTDSPVGACEASEMSAEALLAPIDTIVVVTMENRSFDHYFGSLPLLEDWMLEGLSGDESNPDQSGNAVAVHPLESTIVSEDPPHDWDRCRVQWNNGQNDGFVRAYQAYGASQYEKAMGYYAREHLPVLYALADNYVLCDRWFASVMGATWPNRYYMHLATSNGEMGNEVITDVTSIFDRLTAAGVPFGYYYSNLPFTATYMAGIENRTIADFLADAEAGTLPSFSFLEPTLTAFQVLGNDDHPPADIASGQMFLATVYEALAQSPQWERCLLIITYDEHGGFYDHVPPPTTTDERPEFRQLGFRVPTVVVGPHVRQGCVNSTQMDHVSVLSTATRRFQLEPLNQRVTDTHDVSSCIDPALIDNPRPPITLPTMQMRPPPLVTPGQSYGGQVELARLIEGRAAFDWRRRSEEAMRVVLARAGRFGLLR